MEHSPPHALQQRLAELQALFQQQLPGRLAEIRRSWQQLNGHWDAEELTRLHRMCHSLAGSGGTFGAHDVGQAARALEQRLKALTGSDARPDERSVQQLEALLETLADSGASYLATHPAP